MHWLKLCVLLLYANANSSSSHCKYPPCSAGQLIYSMMLGSGTVQTVQGLILVISMQHQASRKSGVSLKAVVPPVFYRCFKRQETQICSNLFLKHLCFLSFESDSVWCPLPWATRVEVCQVKNANCVPICKEQRTDLIDHTLSGTSGTRYTLPLQGCQQVWAEFLPSMDFSWIPKKQPPGKTKEFMLAAHLSKDNDSCSTGPTSAMLFFLF